MTWVIHLYDVYNKVLHKTSNQIVCVELWKTRVCIKYEFFQSENGWKIKITKNYLFKKHFCPSNIYGNHLRFNNTKTSKELIILTCLQFLLDVSSFVFMLTLCGSWNYKTCNVYPSYFQTIETSYFQMTSVVRWVGYI